MARQQATYIRVCKEEFQALTPEQRAEHLARAFQERQAQIAQNKKMIEWHKEFLWAATTTKSRRHN